MEVVERGRLDCDLADLVGCRCGDGGCLEGGGCRMGCRMGCFMGGGCGVVCCGGAGVLVAACGPVQCLHYHHSYHDHRRYID